MWRSLTGTPLEEQGAAVALVVGGRAARVAEQLDPRLLSQRDGLQILIFALEQRFGAEDQDLQESSLESWEKLYRQRGQTIKDFLIDYELLLEEARARAGYNPDPVTLSRELLRKVRITDDERRWVMLPVQNDYSQYESIRQSLARLPHDHAADPYFITHPEEGWEPQDHDAYYQRNSDNRAWCGGPDCASGTGVTGDHDTASHDVWDCGGFYQEDGSWMSQSMEQALFWLDDEDDDETDDQRLAEFAAFQKAQKQFRKNKGAKKGASKDKGANATGSSGGKSPVPPPGISSEQ